jgi:hypothetical protein
VSRRDFHTALVGGIIGALVVGVLHPVGAAVGDLMKVGKVNTAGAPTTIKGASTATLKLVQNNATGKPIKLEGPGRAKRVDYLNADRLDGRHASFFLPKTGKAADADRLDGLNSSAFLRRDGTATNADRVDGKHASQLAVPSGAVMFFNRATCPSGWSEYTPARGRTVVGLQPGGTLAGLKGSAFTNLETPTATGGTHNHLWAFYDQTGKSWKSLTASGQVQLMYDHDSDGISNAGSGVYPIAPYSTDATGSGIREYYTTLSGDHTHTVDMPYVQLLACRKT